MEPDLRSLVTHHDAVELGSAGDTQAPGHLFYIKSLMGPLSLSFLACLYLSPCLPPDTQHAGAVLVKYAQKVRCAHTGKAIQMNGYLFAKRGSGCLMFLGR